MAAVTLNPATAAHLNGALKAAASQTSTRTSVGSANKAILGLASYVPVKVGGSDTFRTEPFSPALIPATTSVKLTTSVQAASETQAVQDLNVAPLMSLIKSLSDIDDQSQAEYVFAQMDKLLERMSLPRLIRAMALESKENWFVKKFYELKETLEIKDDFPRAQSILQKMAKLVSDMARLKINNGELAKQVFNLKQKVYSEKANSLIDDVLKAATAENMRLLITPLTLHLQGMKKAGLNLRTHLDFIVSRDFDNIANLYRRDPATFNQMKEVFLDGLRDFGLLAPS
jgi:hypothetical protein